MLQISAEELSKHPVLIASPQYGGQCSSIFVKGLSDLCIVGTRHGLPIGTCLLLNESLVTRARNTCADVFMNSKFEHMMFIDADIGFDAQSVLELMVLQIQNPEYDIIGAPYKVKSIVENRYAFQMTKAHSKIAVDLASTVEGITEPIEVSGIATGFMLIRRSVFERFKDKFPHFSYTVDTLVEGSPDHSPKIGNKLMQYFQAEIDPISGHYLSEDYWFSRRCEEIGIRTWLCPWMHLRHAGTHIFE